MKLKVKLPQIQLVEANWYYKSIEVFSNILAFSQNLIGYSFLLIFPSIVLLSSNSTTQLDFSGLFIKYIFSYFVVLGLRYVINPKMVKISFKFDLLLMGFVAFITTLNFIPQMLGFGLDDEIIRESRSMASLSFVIGLIFTTFISATNPKHLRGVLLMGLLVSFGFIVKDLFWYFVLLSLMSSIWVYSKLTSKQAIPNLLGLTVVITSHLLGLFDGTNIPIAFLMTAIGLSPFWGLTQDEKLDYVGIVGIIFLLFATWGSPLLLIILISAFIAFLHKFQFNSKNQKLIFILVAILIISLYSWIEWNTLKLVLSVPFVDLNNFVNQSSGILTQLFGGGQFSVRSGYGIIAYNYGILGLTGFVGVVVYLMKELKKNISVYVSLLFVSIYLLIWGIGDAGFYTIWVVFGLVAATQGHQTRSASSTNSIFKLENRYKYIKIIFEITRILTIVGLLILLGFILL